MLILVHYYRAVNTAPPIKDSGNDLIAVKGDCFRAIQVKTRSEDERDCIRIGRLPEFYHILAIVVLCPGAGDRMVNLDESHVFLLEKDEVEKNQFLVEELVGFTLNRDRIDTLFG